MEQDAETKGDTGREEKDKSSKEGESRQQKGTTTEDLVRSQGEDSNNEPES